MVVAKVACSPSRLTSPHRSLWKAFTTQAPKEPIGIGGPKKQLASYWHVPTPPPQCASEVHAPLPSVPGLPFRQCAFGPAPLVQSRGPLPSLPPSLTSSTPMPFTSSIAV